MSEASPRPWRVVDYAKCPGLADVFDASGSPSGLVAGELKPVDAALIVDANGDGVAACWRTARGDDEKERQYNEANAALIVDAVNERAKFEEARMEFPDFRPVIIAAGQRDAAIAERDRLRDLVRQALPFIEGAIDTVSTILGDAEMSKAAGECGAPPKDVLEAFVADGRRVLREARAAIGEDRP